VQATLSKMNPGQGTKPGRWKKMFDLSAEEITRRLAQALAGAAPEPYLEFPALPQFLTEQPRPAAVLIPFLLKNSAWHLLFTRRHSDLPEHSGQVAFPGGRADPDDPSPEHTALREAHEEIGLEPQDVRLLGRLQDYLTITNYRVTPVVGVIPWPYELHPAEAEVSRVFTIPLDWLAQPENHAEHPRQLPAPYAPAKVVYFEPYDGEVLWGASARMTLNLVQALGTAA
jgi:8-oxo-dGTP pyrophosphatase MutT (NUDIX family)